MYSVRSAFKDQCSERFRFWLAQQCKRPDKCLNAKKGLHNRQRGSKTLAVPCWYTHRELDSVWLLSLGTINQFTILDVVSTSPLINFLTTVVWERDKQSFQLPSPLIQFSQKLFTPSCYFGQISCQNTICLKGLFGSFAIYLLYMLKSVTSCSIHWKVR